MRRQKDPWTAYIRDNLEIKEDRQWLEIDVENRLLHFNFPTIRQLLAAWDFNDVKRYGDRVEELLHAACPQLTETEKGKKNRADICYRVSVNPIEVASPSRTIADDASSLLFTLVARLVRNTYIENWEWYRGSLNKVCTEANIAELFPFLVNPQTIGPEKGRSSAFVLKYFTAACTWAKNTQVCRNYISSLLQRHNVRAILTEDSKNVQLIAQQLSHLAFSIKDVCEWPRNESYGALHRLLIQQDAKKPFPSSIPVLFQHPWFHLLSRWEHSERSVILDDLTISDPTDHSVQYEQRIPALAVFAKSFDITAKELRSEWIKQKLSPLVFGASLDVARTHMPERKSTRLTPRPLTKIITFIRAALDPKHSKVTWIKIPNELWIRLDDIPKLFCNSADLCAHLWSAEQAMSFLLVLVKHTINPHVILTIVQAWHKARPTLLPRLLWNDSWPEHSWDIAMGIIITICHSRISSIDTWLTQRLQLNNYGLSFDREISKIETEVFNLHRSQQKRALDYVFTDLARKQPRVDDNLGSAIMRLVQTI